MHEREVGLLVPNPEFQRLHYVFPTDWFLAGLAPGTNRELPVPTACEKSADSQDD